MDFTIEAPVDDDEGAGAGEQPIDVIEGGVIYFVHSAARGVSEIAAGGIGSHGGEHAHEHGEGFEPEVGGDEVEGFLRRDGVAAEAMGSEGIEPAGVGLEDGADAIAEGGVGVVFDGDLAGEREQFIGDDGECGVVVHENRAGAEDAEGIEVAGSGEEGDDFEECFRDGNAFASLELGEDGIGETLTFGAEAPFAGGKGGFLFNMAEEVDALGTDGDTKPDEVVFRGAAAITETFLRGEGAFEDHAGGFGKNLADAERAAAGGGFADGFGLIDVAGGGEAAKEVLGFGAFHGEGDGIAGIDEIGGGGPEERKGMSDSTAAAGVEIDLEGVGGEVEEGALRLGGEGADGGIAIGEETEFEVEGFDEAAPFAVLSEEEAAVGVSRYPLLWLRGFR